MSKSHRPSTERGHKWCLNRCSPYKKCTLSPNSPRAWRQYSCTYIGNWHRSEHHTGDNVHSSPRCPELVAEWRTQPRRVGQPAKRRRALGTKTSGSWQWLDTDHAMPAPERYKPQPNLDRPTGSPETRHLDSRLGRDRGHLNNRGQRMVVAEHRALQAFRRIRNLRFLLGDRDCRGTKPNPWRRSKLVAGSRHTDKDLGSRRFRADLFASTARVPCAAPGAERARSRGGRHRARIPCSHVGCPPPRLLMRRDRASSSRAPT